MRLTITISALMALALLFSGCGNCVPEIKTVYVKNRVPKLKILHKVEPYNIDNAKIDGDNYVIPKDELEKASAVSQKRIRIINFYERQNMKFNKEFADK